MRYVTTDYKDCPYITAGKRYEVIDGTHFGDLFFKGMNNCQIKDDEDNALTVILEPLKCANLHNKGTWTLTDDTPEEIEE